MRLVGPSLLGYMLLISGTLLSGGCRGRGLPPTDERGGDVRVSSGSNPFVEAMIAAHPTDPASLVATASELIPGRGSRPRAFVSSDGGRTWRTRPLPGVDERAQAGRLSLAFNNWVTFSPDGCAYLSTLTSNGRAKEVLVYRSRDGGTEWSGPAVIPSGGLDFPTMSVARRQGGERLYLAATGSGRTNRHLTDAPDDHNVFPVFSSDDGGLTFQVASVVSAPADAFAAGGRRRNFQAMNIVAAQNGAVVVPFLDYSIAPGPIVEARLQLVRSTDAGARFGSPEIALSRPPAVPNTATLASDGHGRRWYASWTTVAGGHERVLLTHRTVGEGAWQTTLLDRSHGRPHHPTLAVAEGGAIGVAWLEAFKDGKGWTCTRVRFSGSTDAGRTFQAGRWISPHACADPGKNQDWPIIEQAPGGEYMGIAAAADGAFHVIWADGREGPFQVFTTRVAPLE